MDENNVVLKVERVPTGYNITFGKGSSPEESVIVCALVGRVLVKMKEITDIEYFLDTVAKYATDPTWDEPPASEETGEDNGQDNSENTEPIND